MSTHEPGTVAVATVRGVPNVRVMRVKPSAGDDWVSIEAIKSWHWHSDDHVTDVRVLLVLDLDATPRGADNNYANWLRHSAGCEEDAADGRANYRPAFLRWLADQIEAQTKPPRIPEPGLWGVVRVATGFEWVHSGPTRDTSMEWLCENGARAHWHELVNPTLVRPGIEESS